jgi:23S rRNA (cytidine1920-2'-O)/16S rRNA (cytidine1409-2'-O)-methyltransferase
MRLDLYLVDQNLTKTRSQATDLINRGLVLVNGIVAFKPGIEITNQEIKLLDQIRFVGRGGEKLMHALLDLHIDMHDKIVVDIGSSTGGFTDCALQHGAKEVYSYDVGTEQMDIELKKDPRIHLHEGTNILDVKIPDSNIILIDVSFTSIKPILKHIKGFTGEILALIKPQFEAGNINFKQGVLKDLKKHREILISVIDEARNLGFNVHQIIKSELKGKSGNQEYILYMKNEHKQIDIKKMVGDVVC